MSWSHVEDRTVKIRKVQICLLCNEKSQPGERMIKRFGFGDDGPGSFYMHPECEALTDDWDEIDWETCDGQMERQRPSSHPQLPSVS